MGTVVIVKFAPKSIYISHSISLYIIYIGFMSGFMSPMRLLSLEPESTYQNDMKIHNLLTPLCKPYRSHI